MKNEIESLILNFKNYSLTVVGDVMLDYNIMGEVSRISPEAPVPIVDVNLERRLLGGAANVASNLHHLGAKVRLAGVVGDDENGRFLKNSLEKEVGSSDGIVLDPSRPTTTKMRIFSGRHPFIRADFESREEVSKEIQEKLYEQVEKVIKETDALIFEDYNKGALPKDLVKRLVDLCKKYRVMTAVDPKFHHFFDYQGVNIFKPNRKEILNAFGKNQGGALEIEDLAKRLLKKIECESVLLTLSEDGMLLVHEDGSLIRSPSFTKEAVDPSGAGDAVIASFTLSYLASKNWELSMKIASLAAAINCRKVGVSPVASLELMEEASKFFQA